MDKSLTESKARAQVYEYLQRTLNALPKGTSLSLTPDVDREKLSPGSAISCSDDEGGDGKNTPIKVSVWYWVNGVPNGQQAEYVDKMVKTWKSWGWTEATGAASRSTVYGSPDGYSLIANNAQNGPGGVGLAASTPCFIDEHADQTDEELSNKQPSTFKQR